MEVWVQKCYWFFSCVMTWRHDVMSWRHKSWFTYLSAYRCARKLILFLFHGFLGHWVQKCYWFFSLCDDVTSWRHVMTSQNLIYLSQLLDVLESWFFFCFHGFFRSLSSKMLLIFQLCDDVTSWRHVMTSQNLIYLSQLVDVLESWFFFCFHVFF